MIINWYGQSCFKIQTKDTVLYTDPFDKSVGLRPPQGSADIVTVSHNHSDHNNVDAFKEVEFLIDTPGEFALKDINIQGIESSHSGDRGKNTIFTIEVEGIKMCHLGDLGEKLSDEQAEKIGNIDILFVPAGEKVTLSAHDMMKVINEIEPKIVIPMHYKIEGVKVDLEKVDKFVKEIGITPEKEGKLVIKTKDLSGDETMKVIILQKS